jgi:FkbM family methyltransferase
MPAHRFQMRIVRRAVNRVMQRLPSAWRLPKATVRTSNGSSFDIATPFESAEGRTLFIHGETSFEPETTAVFKQLLARTEVLFDIGANIGFYTLLAKCWKPAVRVHAFEPEERAFALLTRSLTINGWHDVTAERIALSDFDGMATLYVPDAETEASLNPTFRADAVERPCQVRTLDSYCRERKVVKIDLLVIDTESTEPRVLAGGRRIIERCRPDIICEVLKGRTEQELTRFLEPLGYRFFHLRPEGPVPTETIEGDATYRCLNYLFTTRRAP